MPRIAADPRARGSSAPALRAAAATASKTPGRITSTLGMSQLALTTGPRLSTGRVETVRASRQRGRENEKMPAMAGPPRPRRDRPALHAHDRWILLVLIVSITFVTFLPTLGNDFVTWDDDDNLTENPFYRGLGWSELRWMWTTALMGHYIPLTWMTFGLDYLVWGMNPVGYHLTNLALHAANAAFFYLIVQQLLTLALHATP